MFGLTRIAANNLAASYQARFSPDPDADGYRFNTSSHGSGAFCPTDQYLDYVREFESFLATRTRYMWWWMVGLFLLCIAAMALLIWLDDGTWFDRADSLVDGLPPAFGGLLFILPLPLFMLQGWRLYRKPSLELVTRADSIQRRRPVRQVMDQRIKGMSGSMLGVGVFIGLLGSALSVFDPSYLEELGGWVVVFPALVLTFGYLIFRQRRIHRAEAALIAQRDASQPSVAGTFDPDRLDQ